MVKVKIKLEDSLGYNLIPMQATKGAAGWDVYANEEVNIPPLSMRTITTGVSMAIPDGYYVSIVPRSSMGKKRIIIPNGPATIDSDFRGILSVMLINLSMEESYHIQRGNRIAQMILQKYETIEFEEVNDLDETERGSGGYGSTGK